MFDGRTFEPENDRDRLVGQLDRVRALMLDGMWRDLASIRADVGGSEAGISARLRDLRKGSFGGYQVERRRVHGGLFEYRVLPPIPTGQGALFAPSTHMPARVR